MTSGGWSRPPGDDPERPRPGEGRGSRRSERVPLWRLVPLGIVRALQGAVFPLRRMWRSTDPLDAYALVHFTSVGGDAILAIALADSVFFSVPAGEAKLRVAAYLLLTMLPLALAGPLLVPLLDRAGPRRAISAAAGGGRALVAAWGASRFDGPLLFPLALVLLVLSKIHAITKNGLTVAYAPPDEGLMRANARLGRVAVAGALVAAPFGFLAVKAWGVTAAIGLAAVVYGVSTTLNVRLPKPAVDRVARPVSRSIPARGRVPELTGPALGAVGMRAAGGFLLFLLAFSLREGGAPASWFVVLAGAGVIGGFVADMVGPRLPIEIREEAVVVVCVLAAGISALLALPFFGLPLLSVYAFVGGAASEFSRLAFQSLMQRHAPPGAFGRVFVRYEVSFQLAWVAGAALPALLPISFRTGIVMLAVFYGALSVGAWWVARRENERA